MNHIGNVIRECRDTLRLSRRELAQDICSEKYLYMIEKGDRTPSSIITNRLGDRMGIDIFKYYAYLDCTEPVRVCGFIRKFLIYRTENDFSALTRETNEALRLKDFRNYPWRYEIELNSLVIKTFGEKNHVETIAILEDMLSKMDYGKINRTTLGNLYVLLSACYQMNHDQQNAERIIALANEVIAGKENMTKFVPVTTLVKISKITLHYLAAQFEDVIEGALGLLGYERSMHYCGYSDLASFYLAFAYYQSGKGEKGIQWFHRALSLALVNFNPVNMGLIMGYEIFDIIMLDKGLSPQLVESFKAEYSLTR